jgi:uncharacterized surface protein with fasciclin (FAS1) repeats
MKKWYLLFILTFNWGVIFAQKQPEPVSIVDSIKAKWGKIKIVNGVSMLSSNDIIENISSSAKYSILLKAIENADLTETFKSKGPITFFAPDNDAFNKMGSAKIDSLLLPKNKYNLSYLLTYHALPGRVTAREISKKINSNNGETTFTTIAGSKLIAKIDSNRNIVLIDENGGKSIINHFDIPQSNGIIHTLNAVLQPKVKEI